ncbi:TMS membrane protein/tumor differentially expressed protein [Meredithblackwellia eburnea MCA 4105]
MGIIASLPLAGLGGSALSACITGGAFFCTSTAASALTKSCNCNSSVATRVGFSLIFLLNSILAWLMLSDWAIKLVQKWSWDYIKVDCSSGEDGGEGKCGGVLAVHRVFFAMALFHLILSLLLINVHSTRSKRAAIQNGWWGPKVLLSLLLLFLSFTIPNPFFMFYGSTITLLGSTLFILIGLVLLIDFAHSWSETCLEKWEETDSPFWKFTLIGSTLSLFALQITLVVLQYVFFAGKGCGLNQFFITFNLLLSILVVGLSISPAVQEANPRSGLAQSGMVVAYTAYLVMSAIANHDDGLGEEGGTCNPLQKRAEGAKTSMIVLGAVFTFLAIAYSTSRAATSSKALVGSGNAKRPLQLSEGGYSSLVGATALEEGEMGPVNTQPGKKESLRREAIMAAVAAGSLPASALDEDSDDDDDGDELDDEKTGTRYNYSWFHVIFILATMYTAGLLTNWTVIKPAAPTTSPTDPASLTNSLISLLADSDTDSQPVKIGRSHIAMWMRIISSWVCLVLYAWSLLAPVILPDRFGE